MKIPKRIHQRIKRDPLGIESSPILGAIEDAVEFIAPTLGPKVRHIIVDNGVTSTIEDDGNTIIRDLELSDPYMNSVLKYVREVSDKTDKKAGDGTTTTMVLLLGLLRAMLGDPKPYPQMTKELAKAKEELFEHLKKISKNIETEEDLYKVAKTSMNDEEAARLVAKIVFEAGKDAAISISESGGRDITYKRLEGFSIPRGVVNRGMINNKESQKAILPGAFTDSKPLVAVTEGVLSTVDDVRGIIEAAQQKGSRNIVLFCGNLIGEALFTVVSLNVRKAFEIVAVQLPGQGEKVKDYMDDICVITGAKLPVGEFQSSDFGTAERIESTYDDTTIIGGGGDKKLIEEHISLLKQKIDDLKEEYDKSYYYQRQARIQGGVVHIEVGGVTETDANLRLKKIEDCVNACKCALDGGVVPGAGRSLWFETSSPILNLALKAPHEKLLENCEAEPVALGEKETINLLTGEVGDFLEVGVVDALKVNKTAVENAITIASVLYNVAGISTYEREENNNEGR